MDFINVSGIKFLVLSVIYTNLVKISDHLTRELSLAVYHPRLYK